MMTMMLMLHRPSFRPPTASIAATTAASHRIVASLVDHGVVNSRSRPGIAVWPDQHHKTKFHSTALRYVKYPAIVTSFQALPLINKLLKKNLHHMKIDTMTKVQHDSFRALTDGKDVNILSPPDSGKTLAFLLPFLNDKLKVQGIKKGIHCIFLTPDSHHASANYLFTSELVQLMGPNITVQSVYDSYSIERQVQRLSKKVPTILIATPARLRQLVEKAVLSKQISRKSPKKRRTDFSNKFNVLTNTLVLDEADVLFRDHRDDVEFIRPYLAMGNDAERHTVLLSSYGFPNEADVKRWTRSWFYEKIDCTPKPMPANPPVKMSMAFADAADVKEKTQLLKKRWRKQLKRLKVAWKEKVSVAAVRVETTPTTAKK